MIDRTQEEYVFLCGKVEEQTRRADSYLKTIEKLLTHQEILLKRLDKMGKNLEEEDATHDKRAAQRVSGFSS